MRTEAERSEAHRKANRKYCSIHRNAIRERDREYYAAHRDAQLKRSREYHATHREARREYTRKYAAAHPEGVRESVRKYRAAHPEVQLAHNAKRRALKLGAFVESVSRAIVYKRDGGRCHLCGKKARKDNWHLDHIMPLSKGGEHSYRNVAVACPGCNLHKHKRPIGQLLLIG